MAASFFCNLPSDWPERLDFSIQVQLFAFSILELTAEE